MPSGKRANGREGEKPLKAPESLGEEEGWGVRGGPRGQGELGRQCQGNQVVRCSRWSLEESRYPLEEEQLGSAPPGGSSENAEWQWRHPVAAGPQKHSCT